MDSTVVSVTFTVMLIRELGVVSAGNSSLSLYHVTLGGVRPMTVQVRATKYEIFVLIVGLGRDRKKGVAE